jgi:hypothetical protein
MTMSGRNEIRPPWGDASWAYALAMKKSMENLVLVVMARIWGRSIQFNRIRFRTAGAAAHYK